MDKSNNIIVGDRGENLACDYLKKNKYKIIETKYRNAIGEIDIIAKKGKVFIFIEVKSRTSDYFGTPGEAVNLHKQNKIRNVATAYLKLNRAMDKPIRFDVIEVLDGKINHIENCF